MKINQDFLRMQCKKIKWEDDISYKVIAEDILHMNYNAFMNFIHGYKELGEQRARVLEAFISDMI